MTGGPLRFLLLHSPLVRPASLAPIVEPLQAAGHTAILPDLTGVVRAPRPTWMIDTASAAAKGRDVDVVIGHSGGGALLPVLSAGLVARAMVFLDAVLPTPGDPVWRPDESMRALLEQHVGADGRLAPWVDWWDEQLVEQMLPTRDQRAAIARDSCRLPLSYYDHPVPVPSTWTPAAYVALGGAYADELRRAADLGWPCRSLSLSHLATVTHPDEVATALQDVLEQLGV